MDKRYRYMDCHHRELSNRCRLLATCHWQVHSHRCVMSNRYRPLDRVRFRLDRCRPRLNQVELVLDKRRSKVGQHFFHMDSRHRELDTRRCELHSRRSRLYT